MDNNICQTCLSKDRWLISQRNISVLLQEINIRELKEAKGGICWECHRILVKFAKFKAQVRHAQESIIYMIQDTKSLSHLSKDIKTNYDFQFVYNSDPLTTVRHKIEIDEVKDEISITNDEQIVKIIQESDEKSDVFVDRLVYKDDQASDNDHQNDNYEEHSNISGDEKPIIESKVNQGMIYADTIKPKIPVKRKLKKNFQIADEEVKEKFTIVVFSEEQMLKNREEKRNHPNFKKIPFKCDTCVLGFTRKETYDVHMEKKHSENIGPYICDVCQMRFPNKRCIERHCGKHLVCYRCRLCKYEAAALCTVLNHCRTKHSADQRDKIHCSQCQVVAKTPEDLAEHIRTQHSLYCNECGEKFKGKNTLRTHKSRIHDVKREFICGICSRAFARKSRLESHMVAHNGALAKKLAYCAACDVQYKNIYVYRSHLKNSANHSERAYPCPECDKKFVSKVYWTKHYNFYHLQKSQFKCEICNKLFISDWRLKNHKQKHHGLSRSRDHPCNVCGKKFYTQSTLRGHQLTHSEQRSYMCEDCGDTFKQRPALYTHSRLVHKGVKRKKLQ